MGEPGRSASIAYCERHPRTETELHCGRCEVAICPQCMVHTPGGVRCPDCAQLRRPPMYQLETRHYVRAAAVALVAAVLIGVVAATLLPPRPFGGLFQLVLALLGGMAAGNGVARVLDYTTNRKRGLAMQLFAAGAVVAGSALRVLISGDFELVLEDVAGAVLLVFGVITAWNRLA